MLRKKALDSKNAFRPKGEPTANNHIDVIDFLTTKIKNMEKMILSKTKIRKPFQVLRSTPGIGTVLGLTIMLEIGDINRFPGAGNYASYCRCVSGFKKRKLFAQS